MDITNRKTVGVEIPGQLHQHIVLAAINLDTSKSQIIRDSLVRWVEQHDKSEEEIINSIIDNIQSAWDKKKLQIKTEKLTHLWKEFETANKERLLRAGVSEHLVNKMLGQIIK